MSIFAILPETLGYHWYAVVSIWCQYHGTKAGNVSKSKSWNGNNTNTHTHTPRTLPEQKKDMPCFKTVPMSQCRAITAFIKTPGSHHHGSTFKVCREVKK